MTTYVALTLLCSFCYAVGAIFCKYGLQHRDCRRGIGVKDLMVYLLTNRYWLVGVVITLSANIAIIQIQSIIDLSVVHSIMNSTYIFTLFLGYTVLREVLSKLQWIGTVIVTLGVLAVLFVQDPITGNATDTNILFSLTICLLGLIICCMAVSVLSKKVGYEILCALAAGIAFGLCQVYVKATTNMITEESGFFSVLSLSSINQFVTMSSTMIIVIFAVIGFICSQISYSRGQVSVAVALIVVVSRVISTSSGYFIFGEHFSLIKLIGIIAILSGVMIITIATVQKPSRVLV